MTVEYKVGLLLACFWWPSNPTVHNEVLSTASPFLQRRMKLCFVLVGFDAGWFAFYRAQKKKTKDIDVTSPDCVKISFSLTKTKARARFGEICEVEKL